MSKPEKGIFFIQTGKSVLTRFRILFVCATFAGTSTLAMVALNKRYLSHRNIIEERFLRSFTEYEHTLRKER
jgi:hypothetical protein